MRSWTCAVVVLAFSFVAFTIDASAQGSYIAPSILLRQPGEGHGIVLTAPSGLTTDPTFTFPSTSGTLLIASSTTSPTFGGLNVTGGPISLDPGSGNDITFSNIAVDGSATDVLVLDGSGRLRKRTFTTTSAWQPGGNTSGITGTNNILGINYASGEPLRLFVEGGEAMRLETGQVSVLAPSLRVAGTLVLDATGNTATISYAGGANRTYTVPLVDAPATFALADGQGASGSVLVSGGTGVRATWQASIPVTSGGTGVTSVATGDLLYADGANSIARLTIGTTGQFLSVSAGGIPQWTSALPSGTSVLWDDVASGTNPNALVVSGSLVATGGGYITATRFADVNSTTDAVDLGTSEVDGVLAAAKGGTDHATYAVGDLLYASGTAALSRLAIGTTGQVLTVSALGQPEWAAASGGPGSVGFADVTAGTNPNALLVSGSLGPTGGGTITANAYTGVLPVANGGTGAATLAANGVLVGNGTSAVSALTTANNAMLVTDGTGVPSISTTFPSGVSVPAAQVSGIVAATNGGTGLGSYTTGDLLYANTTTTLAPITAGADGTVLTIVGGIPQWQTPAGGSIAFNLVTSGTNANALLVSGSLAPTGAGVVTSNQFTGTGSSTTAVDLATAEVAGTLPAGNGGTGNSTYTAGDILYATGATTLTRLPIGTTGQILSVSAGVPAWTSTGPNAFPSLTGGTNTAAAMVVGTGASLSTTGTGFIQANRFVGTGSTTNAVDLATAEVAGTLPVANGGTGATTLTANRLLVGNGTGAITALATANNAMLVTNGTGVPSISTTFPSGVSVPATQITGTITASQFVGSGSTTTAVDLATAEVGGTLPVGRGGTGATTFTTNGLLVGNGTSAVTALATANNAMLVTNGSGVPSISTTFPSGVSVPATQVTGTLPVARGGTGVASYATGDILYATGATTLTRLPIGTAGQVLTVAAGIPSWVSTGPSSFATLTGGTNTAAAMVVGTGASLSATGTGFVQANRFVSTGSTSDAVDLASGEVLGTLPVGRGGTGATTFTTNGLLVGNGTSAVTALATANNAMLVTNGSGVPSISTTFPSGVSVPATQVTGTITASQFVGSGSATTAVDLATAEVGGTLPVGRGGTGATTHTANGVVLGNGTGAMTTTAVGAAGTVLTGTGAAPAFSSTPTVARITLSNTTNQIVMGTTNTTTLSATAPAASRTYTLPDVGANADVVLTQGAQTVSGSKTFVDNMILGTGASAGQLRFREPSAGGSNFSSFQAGTQAADIQYTLPTSAPTAGQVLRANATTPTNLEWASPAGTVVFNRRTAALNDGGGFTAGLTVTLAANKVYTFTARLIMTRTTNTGLEIRFTNGTGTIASGSYSYTRATDAVGGSSSGYSGTITTAEEVSISAAGATNHYVLNGLIVMGATGGTVTLDFNRSAPAAGVATMEAGSYIHLTEVE